MPLAGISASISGVCQIVINPSHVLAQAQTVGRNPVFVWVETRVKGSPCRRADRGRGERPVKTNAARGQCVDVRGPAHLVQPVATHRIEPLLIGHQDDDIGLFGHWVFLSK